MNVTKMTDNQISALRGKCLTSLYCFCVAVMGYDDINIRGYDFTKKDFALIEKMKDRVEAGKEQIREKYGEDSAKQHPRTPPR